MFVVCLPSTKSCHNDTSKVVSSLDFVAVNVLRLCKEKRYIHYVTIHMDIHQFILDTIRDVGNNMSLREFNIAYSAKSGNSFHTVCLKSALLDLYRQDKLRKHFSSDTFYLPKKTYDGNHSADLNNMIQGRRWKRIDFYSWGECRSVVLDIDDLEVEGDSKSKAKRSATEKLWEILNTKIKKNLPNSPDVSTESAS